VELAAQRAASEAGALSASADGVPKLPLPRPLARPAAAARAQGRLAEADGRARLLVGVTEHRHLDAVAALLEQAGEDLRRLESVGIVAVTVDSPAALVARLGDDPRVAFIERSREREATQEPADRTDPETGIKIGWAYDAVRAGPALAAVGGASQKRVSVIDTGLDVNHPDLRSNIFATLNTFTGGSNVTDRVGHGTFVTGLIAMRDGNGIGGKGVAGNTPVAGVLASTSEGLFPVEAVVAGLEASIRSRVSVINLSLGGDTFTESEARAFELAFFEDVLPVAAAGNSGAQGNPVIFPAALLGGRNGDPGIGLAVGATKPDDTWAEFSSHGFWVSVAAPGQGQSGLCPHGVFSTIPGNQTLDWDSQGSCNQVFRDERDGSRYAYGPGTSFAAPIAAGVSSVAWQAEPRLQSQQVAEVIMRSARQTRGPAGSWNEFTGRGVVNSEAAVALARVYDVLSPGGLRVRQRRRGNRLRLSARGAVDRTNPGDELAGLVQHAILVSVNGGSARLVKSSAPDAGSVSHKVRLRRRVRYRFFGAACDANGNCAVRRLRRVRGR
jgi:subtilisin family serine protease